MWMVFGISRFDGEFVRMFPKLRISPRKHFKYFRMTTELFDDLLALVTPKIKHSNTHATPVPPAERLTITLKILATGNSQVSVAHSFCLGHSTVSVIFRETTSALWEVLHDRYVPVSTIATWEASADRFQEKWNFPNCVGAVDGKHVIIERPKNSGTEFFNYKKSFSLVLMAVVDADYRFCAVDVGEYGRQSDGGTFGNWDFGCAIKQGAVDLPKPRQVGAEPDLKYVFVGDAAFSAGESLLVPYPGENLTREQRIYNYRLSRARRVVENAFGIMAARWRIFRSTMCYQPVVVDNIVLACIAGVP